MKKSYLVAIDAGTTGERTMIFDEDSNIVAWEYLEHPSYFPQLTWVEQNATDWWDRVCRTTVAALKKASTKGITPDMISGVSVTNQRETIVPVDENVDPLRRAIIWQDRRTTPQCEWISQNLGRETVYKTTGLIIDPYFSAPKIRWIMENEPEIYKRTHKFLLVHDYLITKLADVFITSWDNASRTMLFDIREFEWSKILLDSLEIEMEKLPEPHPSGKKVGEITSKASGETGLAEGTPLICGGGDQQCGAIGVGVVHPGRSEATTGTGTFLITFLEKPTLDPEKRVLCSCHAVPKKWIQEASIFSTGAVYKWFRDEFGLIEKSVAESIKIDPYELLNLEATLSPVGSKGLLFVPHFVGAGSPYWDPNAKGVILGLTLGHSRHDLIRAILEGICLEIKKNIEIMKELGAPIEEVRVTGGFTRNPTFNQIQADVYGVPVLRAKVEESTALGCAILAGVGSGIFKDIETAVEKMVKITERYEPRAENKKRYDKLFDIHKKIYSAFKEKEIFKDLSGVGS